MEGWSLGIFELRTGEPQIRVAISEADWDTRLTGKGAGNHVVPLYHSGLPPALVRELKRPNKYAVCQIWGDSTVAFTGVVGRSRFAQSKRALVIDSTELRAAYLNDRMLYGVNSFGGAGVTLLELTSVTHQEAVNEVIDMATPTGWELPIDAATGSSGDFSATWTFDERMKVEDHLRQIEQDGCEIAFTGYLDENGWLRFRTDVAQKISIGEPTDLAADAPGSRVIDLDIDEDGTKQMTGVLGFGRGGASGLRAWAGWDAEIEAEFGPMPVSVRDTWVNFPDITDQARLQAAVDATFRKLLAPTVQWSCALNIWGMGPAFAAPGHLLNMWVYGSEVVEDGLHEQRVIAVRGDAGLEVTPELQDANLLIEFPDTGPLDDLTDPTTELANIKKAIERLQTSSVYYGPVTGGYYSGGGLVGIGIDVVQAIARSTYDSITPNSTTLYAINEGA